MALNITELFGYPPGDKSKEAQRCRHEKWCPFIDAACTKKFRDGEKAGVCTVKQTTSSQVICCPNRMYAESYKILSDTATEAFGTKTELYPGNQAVVNRKGRRSVAVFGKGWGHELRLPSRGNKLCH